ncbi:MAG: hypothetical protein Q9184_000228 [Pyrenodesmia sp. 2 TL-2023]
MDDDEQQRRQYEQYAPGYPQHFRPNVRESSAAERLGQSQMITGRSPASASVASITGVHTPDVGSYGYPQGHQYPPAQVHSSSLQFPTDYNQDLQRSHFPQYTSQMGYNVSQQRQPRSPYDAMPQYQPRQSAAIEVLSNQFGVPQYFHTAESVGGSAQTSPAQQYTPSHFQQPLPYQAPGLDRPSIPEAYPAGMAEYADSGAQQVAEQGEPQTSSQDDEHNDRFPAAIRQVFRDTSEGRLVEATQSLLEISDWLLVHAQELGNDLRCGPSLIRQTNYHLGLASDYRLSREDRLNVWKEFNTCWLAVLQRQKDDTQQMMDTGQPPVPPQNLLQAALLERMAEALVSLCDGLEKYGLVDYEMGVWEEEIMSSEARRFTASRNLTNSGGAVLTQCLDLLEGDEAPTAESDDVDPRTRQGSAS